MEEKVQQFQRNPIECARQKTLESLLDVAQDAGIPLEELKAAIPHNLADAMRAKSNDRITGRAKLSHPTNLEVA